MAATTISRTWVGSNDDGSGTTGTVLNAAYFNLIADAVDGLFSGTGGITLNQAGGDGAILTLESSDVAHGVTGIAATAAYGLMQKVAGADGGVQIYGLTEATIAIKLEGISTSDNTTKSTAATAPVYIQADAKSGTSVTAPGANANLVCFGVGAVGARFILDVDGDSHQDVGTAWTNFDAFDDVAMLNALTGVVSREGDPLRQAFGGLVVEHRAALVANRIVTINDGPGDDGSIFVNWSRFHMLMIGAVRQIGRQLAAVESRTLALEGAR